MTKESRDGATETEKKNVSRRGFLKAAAAGAAGTGFAMTAPRILTGELPVGGWLDGTPSGDAREPMVAYIGDPSTGEIVLMAGEREVRIRDFGITSWFVRAVSGM